MSISMYLVGVFGAFSASAMGASPVVRSLFGAPLPLGGRKMFETLGLEWGSSLLAFIAVTMIPVPFVFYKYGGRLRSRNLRDVQF